MATRTLGDPSNNNDRVWPQALTAILLCGSVVRFGLWLAFAEQPVQVADAQDYNRLAVGLVEERAYLTASGKPSSLRPPLYPLVIAVLYEVFGLENYQAVRAFQGILSLATVVIVYFMGRLAFDRDVGVLAAGVTCFYPSLLGFNNLLLSETLFTFLLVLSTWLAMLAVAKQSWQLLAITGFCLGLGALTRSILWLYSPFLSIYFLGVWQGSRKQRFGAAVIPLATMLFVVAPWAYRNTVIQDTLTIVDVMGGRNAMMGNYEYTPLERSWATVSDVTGERSWDQVLRQKYPAAKGMTQGQLDKLAMRHGIQFVLSHPILTAKRTVVRFFNYWQLERTMIAGMRQGLWGNFPGWFMIVVALLIVGSYVGTLFLGIVGLMMTRPKDRRFFWLFILSIAFPCLIHSVIFAHSRYHLPTMPILFLFTASAATQWSSIWKRRDERAFRLAAVLCFVFVLGWARELVFVDLAQASKLLR